MSELVYLYAYIPPGDGLAAELRGLRGVADRPVELVPCGSATAVVSRVPAEEYSPDRIEQRLTDLSWLGEHGIAHERVVAALVDRMTVLPMRLFTLFSALDALRGECDERSAWIDDSLAKLEGLRQWDLKVSYDSDRMLAVIGESSEEVAAIDAELEHAAPGKRYLLQRRREDVARTAVRQAVASLGDEVLAHLAPAAAEVKRMAPPSSVEPGELPVILAAALLVSRENEGRLRELLVAESDRLTERGVSIACSGPWAAYSLRHGVTMAEPNDPELPVPVDEWPGVPDHERLALVELVNRVLDKGVMVTGEVTISIAGVDLVFVGLQVILSSVETLERSRHIHSAGLKIPADPRR